MRLISVFVIVAAIMLSSVSCKKDSSNPEQGTLTIGITDTRSTQKAGKDIIDASKLTKFEITISKIELRTEDASFISVLEEETSVNLSNYQGNVKELSSMNVPVGKYTGVIIYFSGEISGQSVNVCPDGWIRYKESCYFVGYGMKLSFIEAEVILISFQSYT